MALRRLTRPGWAAAAGLLLTATLSQPAAAEEPKSDASFLHGAGQAVDGVVLELPKTVLEGTLEGPPVVGTVVGILAGAVKAAQKTAAGIAEMAEAFDPWGTKRKPQPGT